ncbi:cmp deaminase : CMP deaminase OS=Endozoicomonas elysicola GN=GV64_11940 PE=4 SV=1: dCMP_cyt_deam_1 [Gemmataceae bacterium]|nr:cmp deaminase : CMP deaminase OS=Endozoicomonas elysicola GN=GV64_11940 PE=4 SV=1: dCMP_cyt_deam_1 [Gemmataceae bacterium]VTT96500.1 cmp deaminase : CMP deaminase OS=Endozoicomonas elysicola GN=GV64_11940 PE=4 SV=1: dCMP_cyt_deam_1 [Gemmataceae bacterium]
MSGPDHERYIRRAIELTTNAPDLPFAAVIVHRGTGDVVAEGWNKSSENPTLHGEIDAINNLIAAAPDLDRSELVLYTTAEPCPMCQGAILWSGIGAVVFGASIRFLLDIGWRQIDVPAAEVARRAPGCKCEVVGGVLEAECNELFLTASRAAPGR